MNKIFLHFIISTFLSFFLFLSTAHADPLEARLDKLDVICKGDSTGYAVVLADKGNPPYAYQWSSGETTKQIHHKTAGNYSVTITDAGSGNLVKSVTILGPVAADKLLRKLASATTASNMHYFTPSGSLGWVAINVCLNDSRSAPSGPGPNSGPYASTKKNGSPATWYNRYFSNSAINSINGYDISGIEVLIDGSDRQEKTGVIVELTKNAGTSYTSTGHKHIWNCSMDSVRRFGSPVDLWGTTWTNTDFGSNFGVKLTKIGKNGKYVYIDKISIIIYTTQGITFSIPSSSRNVIQPNTVPLTGTGVGGFPGGGFYTCDATPAAVQDSTFFSNLAAVGVHEIRYKKVDVMGCTAVSNMELISASATPNCNIVGLNTPVCVGDTLRLLETTVSPVAAGTSYTWSPLVTGSGTIVGTSNTAKIFDFPNIGTVANYTYILNMTGTSPCSVNVVVNPRPATPALSAVDSHFCTGRNLILQTPHIPNFDYHWTGPNGFVANGDTVINHTVVFADSGYYFLSVRSPLGCRSFKDSLLIDIYRRPRGPRLQIDTPVCYGDPLRLSSFSNQTGLPLIYPTMRWRINGTADTITTATHILELYPKDSSFYQNGFWHLIITDNNGCSSRSQTALSTIKYKPLAPVLYYPSPICYDSDIELNLLEILGATYTWCRDSLLTDTIQSAIYSELQLQNRLIDTTIYIVISVNGCTSPRRAAQIQVDAALSFPQIQANTLVCEGDTARMATVTAGLNYEWTTPSGQIIYLDSAINLPNITLADTGFYFFSMTDNNGCSYPDTSIHLSVNPRPTTPFIQSKNIVCRGDTLIFKIANTSDSINWYSPNGLLFPYSYDTIIEVTPSFINEYQSGVWTAIKVDRVTGCSSEEGYKNIMIQDPPTPRGIFSNMPICRGDSVTLTTSYQSNVDYRWYLQDKTTAIDSFVSTVTIGTVGGDTMVYLLMNDISYICASVDSIAIQYYPTALAQNILQDITTCEYEDIRVSTSLLASEYHWLLNGVSLPSYQTSSFLLNGVTSADAGTYILATEDFNGCDNPADTFTLVVNQALNGSINLRTSTICANENILMWVNRVSGGNSDTTVWISPLGNRLYGYGDTLRLGINDANYMGGTWRVECYDTTTYCYSELSTYFQIDTKPTTSIRANNPFCAGHILGAKITAPSLAATSYSWFYGSGTAVDPAYTYGDSVAIPNLSKDTTLLVSYLSNLGCSYTDTFAIYLAPDPTMPRVLHFPTICEGDGIQIIVSNIEAGVSYTWYTNASRTNILTVGAVANIASLNTATSYYLRATSTAGCTIDTMTYINVIPTNIVRVLPTYFTVCQGNNVLLPSNNTSASTPYWLGPNALSSNQTNLVLYNTTMADGGTYYLYLIDTNGCRSSLDSTTVIVNPSPPTPLIQGLQNICEGDSILLMSLPCYASTWTNSSNRSIAIDTLVLYPSDAEYQTDSWLLTCTDSLTGCSTSSAAYLVDITPKPSVGIITNGSYCQGTNVQFNALNPQNSASYTWQNMDLVLLDTGQTYILNSLVQDTIIILEVEYNNCVYSTRDTLRMNIPIASAINSSATPCEGQPLSLTTTATATAYTWTSPNGTISNNASLIIPAMSLADTGVYTLALIDANGCISPDTSMRVGFNPSPLAPVVLGTTTLCDGDTISLYTATNYSQITWQSFGGNITTTDTLRLMPIDNDYSSPTWNITVSNSFGCTNSTILAIAKTAMPLALITNNGAICSGSTAIFSAGTITGATYRWYDWQTNNLLGSSPNLSISNLTQSQRVRLEVERNNCIASASDSIGILASGGTLIANSDSVKVLAGTAATLINVVNNDSLPSSWNISIYSPLTNGSLSNYNNGSFELDMTGVNSNQTFVYEICDPTCGLNCDTAAVYVLISTLDNCIFPNIFTPNGDHINDVFEIPCLVGLGNQLLIFNRWGDLIYETDNYQNDWDGTHRGIAVPDGTYFYILKNNTGEEKQSSIEVRR